MSVHVRYVKICSEWKTYTLPAHMTCWDYITEGVTGGRFPLAVYSSLALTHLFDIMERATGG